MILLMNILRKLGTSLCAALLSIGLFGVAWSNVGAATIRDKETVKGWFDSSGFYTKVVDIVLEKVKEPGKNTDDPVDISIEDPQIQAIAKGAFTPEVLKTNVEKFLDSGYDWLDGSTDKLAFSIDLTSAKQNLATGLGDYVTTKAAALPICATNEPIDDFDAFNAICRPRGLTPEAAGQQVTNKLLTGDQFLANPVLTSDDFKVKDKNGNEIPIDQKDEAKIARRVYRLSGFIPIMFGIVSLLAALGVIFISRDRLKGVKRVGYVLLATGVVLLITHIGLGVASSVASEKLGNKVEAGSSAQNKLLADGLRVVIDDVRSVLVIYTIGYISLGVIAIITGAVLKKRRDGDKKPSQEEDKEAETPEDTTLTDKSEEKVESKPAPKPPKKIQL